MEDLLKLNTCFKDRLDLLKQMFTSEIKSMNLPVLDPYIIKDLKVSQKSFLSSFEGTVKHAKIEGLKDSIVEDIFFDPTELFFRSTIRIPKITLSSANNITGRILFFNLPATANVHTNHG